MNGNNNLKKKQLFFFKFNNKELKMRNTKVCFLITSTSFPIKYVLLKTFMGILTRNVNGCDVHALVPL